MHEFRKLHKMGESKKLKVVYKTAKKNKKILVTCDISPSVIKGVISFKFHWMHGFETSMIYTKNSIRCFLHKFEIQVDAKELGIEPFIVNINRTRES